MEDRPTEYLYHVYKITKQGSSNDEYLAEGPGIHNTSYEPVEPLITDLENLPKAIVREHLYYLEEQGFTHVSKSEDLYMAFSFKPTCQKIMREGNIYSAGPLSKAEQDEFSKSLKQIYESLDDLIDFKQQGNPLR